MHEQTSERASVARVTSEQRGSGEAIKARRERHGMTRKELAERAQVSRTTLIALEEGRGATQGATMGKVIAALDAFEEETGATIVREEPGLVTYRVHKAGVDVTLSGPVESIPDLERSVERLLRKLEGNGE